MGVYRAERKRLHLNFTGKSHTSRPLAGHTSKTAPLFGSQLKIHCIFTVQT